ncbi:MAG TPA: dipeptidase PepV [Halanaerobiales bacterium]|nr:dipeptidase PepV [Halanaerobiales bacterium]
MLKDLNNRIEEMRDNIIATTQELVRIKSVQDTPKEGKPFGEGVNKALEATLEIAKNMGFETGNIDGYAGYAEMGQGDEMLGILCHLDVVPEGSNWSYPPYAAEIHDDKIYGRGTIDDKGPAVAALYAMKAVKDSDITLNKRVRIIFGTNEESGWGGMDYYLENAEVPDLGFSPDAEFPVIHAEKGILIFKLKEEFESVDNKGTVKVKSIKGGNAPNMVPDHCEAELEGNYQQIKEKLNEFLTKNDYDMSLEKNDDLVLLKSEGVSAHGSMPADGQNAISQLMTFLGTLDLGEDDIAEFISFYNDKIGMEYYGQSIGCGFEDEVSGKLIFNVGVIDLSSKKGEITVNIRYPVTNKAETVYSEIKDKLNKDIELEETQAKDPLYVEKDDPLVKNLMEVYRDIVGDEDSEPIAIGGGTYARAIEKAVAFGPLFPGQIELAHQKDEYIGIPELIQNAKIYAGAVAALASENK